MIANYCIVISSTSIIMNELTYVPQYLIKYVYGNKTANKKLNFPMTLTLKFLKKK